MTPAVDDNPEVEPPHVGPPTQDYECGDVKRVELAAFLARQQNLV